jgi:4,5-DOPA dioxygenase extradiol
MPAFFFGHGNPMHAIASNEWTEGWAEIGRAIPKPKAILAVSAHWYPPATLVTANERPRTIHDFGGFPKELYAVQYPAPGEPDLARRVQQLLEPIDAALDTSWGLDHGTWAVLRHVYPKADVPVIQLSIDETQPPRVHYDIGRRLASLRDEGILVAGSGNLVHNLHAYGWGKRVVEPHDWAVRFETQAREWMSTRHHEPLIAYENLGRDAMLAVPTPDHYLPLLYILGMQQSDEHASFPIEGVDGGSISMLTVRIG